MEGLLSGSNTVHFKLFDLRSSSIRAENDLQFKVDPGDMMQPWSSVIGKYLRKGPLASGDLDKEQIHWVATSRQLGSEIEIKPPFLPLHMVATIEHGIVVLPSQYNLRKCTFVLHKGRSLVVVALDDASVRDLTTVVASCKAFKGSHSLKLVIKNRILQPDQNVGEVYSNTDQDHRIMHAIAVDLLPLVLVVMDKDYTCPKKIFVAPTQTALDASERTSKVLRNEGLLKQEESLVLWDPKSRDVVEPGLLMHHVINQKQLQTEGLPTSFMDFMQRNEEGPVRLTALRRTSNSFKVNISLKENTIPFFVTKTTTVLELKRFIDNLAKDCEVSSLKVTLDSHELADHETMEQCGIKKGRTVYVKKREPITLLLSHSVPCTGTQVYSVEINQGDLVGLLLSRASMLIGLPEEELALWSGGKWLDEGKPLKAFDLQDQDKVKVCHSPNKAILHIRAPNGQSYTEFVKDSRNVTMKTIINTAAAKLNSKASEIFLVQHPLATILPESGVVKDVILSSGLGRLSVHHKPVICAEECQESGMRFRFQCSQDPEVGIRRELILVVNGKTFVQVDEGSHGTNDKE